MLSVVVPVYPISPEVTGYFWECISRIRRCTSGSYELVVVQNGGEKLENRFDEFLYKPYPLGFARALNLGLAWANGYLLACVCADVWVEPDWNLLLHEALEQHGPGYICPTDLPGSGVRQFEGWGPIWMTTREVFTQVGYDDELLNHRYSDQDRWIRAKQRGYRLLQHGDAKVQHFMGSTVNHMPERERWKDEERLITARYGCSMAGDWMKMKGIA